MSADVRVNGNVLPLVEPSRVRVVARPARIHCAHDDMAYRAVMLAHELHRTRWERRAVTACWVFLGWTFGLMTALAIALSNRPPAWWQGA